MSSHLQGLEKERDFYFAKVCECSSFSDSAMLLSDHCGIWQLRDIEILVQAQLEVLEAAQTDDETLREIQKILCSTEVRPEDSIAFFHSFSPFVFVTSMVTVHYPPIT